MKKQALILIPMAACMALTGCGQKNIKTELMEKNVINLSWWGNDSRHTYMMDGVDLFESQNPDIDVKISYGDWNGYETKTQVYMESGNEADVMLINYSWLGRYSPTGEGYYDLYELSDYIDLSTFGEEYLQYGIVNGKLNALPTAMNTVIMCFNQDIFDKYGLELPTDWDDLFEAAEVMREDGIYVMSIAKKHAVIMLYSYYEQLSGKQAFNSDGQFLLETSDIEIMLDFYKSLVDEKVMIPLGDYDRNQFTNGQAAGTAIWVSDAGNYCNALENNGGSPVIVDYPMLENAKSQAKYIKPSTLYAISKNTENPVAAAKLLNFLLNNQEMALLTGTEKGVPISSSALSALSENDKLGSYEYEAYEKMHMDSANMSILYPAMENDSALNAFKNGADEYLYDKMTIEEAAQLIYDNIHAVLED
ncbi:MAG: ABC transporter substrate-binding protein [Lachnospiraceae bacterium]|nr:ABC transporter substrate-binding protein [Lachnospiraceae bacterium]